MPTDRPVPTFNLADYTLEARDHLLIRGLMDELPPVGAEFPAERREAWMQAMLGAFTVLYERPGAGGGAD